MDYKVIYSKRRTLSLSVRDGEVIVRAPFGAREEHILKLVNSHIDWIEKHLKIQAQRKQNHPDPTPEEEEILRKRAKEVLTEKTAHFAEIMGIKYGRITITGAKTRFGSCSSKGNISYSFRLLGYPDEAVDYVVVHELAHIAEMNHSVKFYKVVESVLPDYKERQKMLKG